MENTVLCHFLIPQVLLKVSKLEILPHYEPEWKGTKDYGLGAYGVDPASKTAWAVVNYNGEFAVARDIESVPGQNR